MWQNIWPNSETLLVYLHMSPFSINGWMAAWKERRYLARSSALSESLLHISSWSLFRFGKGLYKEEYRGPGKKLDRDSNTGNCKYYVFEKSITLLTNNGTFRNSCYTVEPRSSLISSSALQSIPSTDPLNLKPT